MANKRKPYYGSLARRLQIYRWAKQWPGTPFHKGAAVPGRFGGVDCVRLAAAAHECSGAIPAVDWAKVPDYPLDWARHHDWSLMEQVLEELGLHSRADRIADLARARVGDTIILRPGRCAYHMGTAVATAQGMRMLHCLTSSGAAMVEMRHPWVVETFGYILRPMESEGGA